MSKIEEKRTKKAAGRAKKLAATHKKLEPFVASFWMDGKEIQAQRPYRSKEEIQADQDALATLKGVNILKIEVRTTDNRNLTEKKKAGVKETAAEKRVRKKAKDEVKADHDKDRPLKPRDGDEQLKLNPQYKPESNEDRLRSYDEVSLEMEEHDREERAMKERHSTEKAAWQEKESELRAELYGIRCKQMDLFKDQPPAVTVITDGIGVEYDKPDLANLEIPDGMIPDMALFFEGLPDVPGKEPIEVVKLDKSNIPQAMGHMPIEEYVGAIRDMLSRELKTDESGVTVAWMDSAKIDPGSQTQDKDGKTPLSAPTEIKEQAGVGQEEK